MQAVDHVQRALRLTPLHPHRYFYDSLAATACISAGLYDQALEHAQRSLRANRKHTSTLRAVAVSQWQLGMHAQARNTAQELMKLEPTLTIGRWLERAPSAPYRLGQEVANVFRKLGVPD